MWWVLCVVVVVVLVVSALAEAANPAKVAARMERVRRSFIGWFVAGIS